MKTLKLLALRILTNLEFKLYKYENTDINIIKIEIIFLINKHFKEKDIFNFNSFKLRIQFDIYKYKNIYNDYSSELNEMYEILKIKNNDIFIIEFTKKINEYNNLFILFLIMCKN